MKAGFIGLGIMGRRMAARIMAEGISLKIHNRTRGEAAEELIKQGAVWCDSPARLAAEVDVVFTMLADPDAVRGFAAGSDGLLSGARPGMVWVDSSTVDPAFSREMAELAAEREVRFLDAPVAGSKQPAETGQLLFLVGGDGKALQEMAPFFGAMGRKALHFGEAGSGSSMKMVINLMLGQSMVAFSEAFALGRGMGLNPNQLFSTLLGTALVPPLIKEVKPRLEAGDFEPNFPLKHLHKDLVLAGKTAGEKGVDFTSGKAAVELFRRALEEGRGDQDFAAIFAHLAGEL